MKRILVDTCIYSNGMRGDKKPAQPYATVRKIHISTALNFQQHLRQLP